MKCIFTGHDEERGGWLPHRATAIADTSMSVTYYVALPFLKTEDGIAAGQAQEMPSASAAIRRAELMSQDPLNAGALAFRRTGDPNSGDFGEPSVLKSFGEVPNTLDES